MNTRPCRECGTPFIPSRRPALHCSETCRTAFNRRRRERGAELYDFVMAGQTAVVEMLLGAYKTADMATRDGRPSFQPTQQAILAIPATFGLRGDNR